MEKLIYTGVLALITFLSAFAQVGQTELQGQWKIEAFELSGVSYEFATEKVTLSEELKAEGEPSAAELLSVSLQLKDQLAPYESNFLLFTGDNLKIHYGGSEVEVKYQVKQEGSKTYFEATYPNGKSKQIEFVLKDEKLELPSVEQGTAVNMVFKRSI